MEDEPAILEVNTVPGFSKMSILPQQLKCAGISIKRNANEGSRTGLAANSSRIFYKRLPTTHLFHAWRAKLEMMTESNR